MRSQILPEPDLGKEKFYLYCNGREKSYSGRNRKKERKAESQYVVGQTQKTYLNERLIECFPRIEFHRLT